MFRLIAILLLSSLLWQLFLPIPVMVDYTLRYKEYSQQLCENRDNPNSHCLGSCQVSKILQGESSHNQEPALPAFNIPSDWLFSLINLQLATPILPHIQPLNFIFSFYHSPSLKVDSEPPQD